MVVAGGKLAKTGQVIGNENCFARSQDFIICYKTTFCIYSTTLYNSHKYLYFKLIWYIVNTALAQLNQLLSVLLTDKECHDSTRAPWRFKPSLLTISLSKPSIMTLILMTTALLLLVTGSRTVTETIRVRAEGNNIRRGIYRDFPTHYRDRLGNRYRVGFELLAVQRDGRAEAFHRENRSNGIRIYG